MADTYRLQRYSISYFLLISAFLLLPLTNGLYYPIDEHECDIVSWAVNNVYQYSHGDDFLPYHFDEGKITNIWGDDQITLFQYESGKISGLGYWPALEIANSEPVNYTDVSAAIVSLAVLDKYLYCWGTNAYCSSINDSAINGSTLQVYGYNGTIGILIENNSLIWYSSHTHFAGNLAYFMPWPTLNLGETPKKIGFMYEQSVTKDAQSYYYIDYVVVLYNNGTLLFYNDSLVLLLRLDDINDFDCGASIGVAIQNNGTILTWKTQYTTVTNPAAAYNGTGDVAYVWVGLQAGGTSLSGLFVDFIFVNGSILHVGAAYTITTLATCSRPSMVNVSDIVKISQGYTSFHAFMSNGDIIGWGKCLLIYHDNISASRPKQIVTMRFTTTILLDDGNIILIGIGLGTAVPAQPDFSTITNVLEIKSQVPTSGGLTGVDWPVTFRYLNNTIGPDYTATFYNTIGLVAWDAYLDLTIGMNGHLLMVFENGSAIVKSSVSMNASSQLYLNTTSVCMGYNFGVIVTNGNEVHVFGATTASPYVFNYPSDLGYISTVKCGRYHVAALLVNASVVTWGDSVTHPSLLLPAPLDNVREITLNVVYTAALFENDTVYVWGETAKPVINQHAPSTSTRHLSSLTAGQNKLMALLCDDIPTTPEPTTTTPAPTTTTPEPTTTTPEPTTTTPEPVRTKSAVFAVPIILVVLFGVMHFTALF